MSTTLSHALVMSVALLQPAPATPPAPPAPPTPATPAATPAVAPAAPAKATFTVNSEEAPDLAEWGEKAKTICEEWFPKLVKELDSEGFKPRDTVEIVFKKTMRVPAATSAGTIMVNAEYVRDHKDDFGMMVHELVHVVQAYRRQKADLGWLTEGIADYIRFWKYEPKVRQRPIDREKASYKNSYRTSAAFLGWLTDAHDKDIVNKLNAKMRKGGADDTIFNDLLGKSVDDLWKEFIDAGAPAAPKLPEEPAQAPAAPAAKDPAAPKPEKTDK